jgi:hypothetical protein
MGQIGAINAQVCARKSCQKFFTANAPDPSHWTPNSYFGASRHISLVYELWGNTSPTGAINAKVRATKSHPIQPIGP